MATEQQALFNAADRVLVALKPAIEVEVNKNLSRIAKALLHPSIKLTWNAISNNCQHLVDNLLSGEDFEYFFPRLPVQSSSPKDGSLREPWPRYSMSFGDRVDSSLFSFQQPESLLSEFLRQRQSGGDILHFLSMEEQRNDNDLRYLPFLLDPQCMKGPEARKATFSLLWHLPRDTLSFLQYHLLCNRTRYSVQRLGPLDHRAWLENRLLLLALGDVFATLSGSLGSCLLKMLRENPSLTKKVMLPKARILGSMHVGEKVRIVQLPGHQTVYMIRNKLGDLADSWFNTSEDDLSSLAATFLHRLQFWKSDYDRVLSETVVKFLKRVVWGYGAVERRPKRGFSSVTSATYSLQSDPTNFISALVATTVRAAEVRGRNKWMQLDFGDVIFVFQLFKKSKIIRKEKLEKVSQNKIVDVDDGIATQ